MSDYNPNRMAFGCEDATIGGETYIVTAYNRTPSKVEVDFQNSKGGYRDSAWVDGKTTATMTIEAVDEDQDPPADGSVFDYDGYSHVVKNVAPSRSAGSAKTWAVELNVLGPSDASASASASA